MMPQYYTQLRIKFTHADYTKFTYTATIGDVEVVKGVFDAKGESKKHLLPGWLEGAAQTIQARYAITAAGMLLTTVNAKFYAEGSGKISEHEFKTTTDRTRLEENYIREIVLDDTPVGWYLVKQPEMLGTLINRIYKNPASANWDALAANNPHIKNVASRTTMLMPGQIVIISQEKSGHKIARLKADAQKAHAAWEQASKEHVIDPVFLNLLELKLQGHKLTMEQPERYRHPKGDPDTSVGVIETGKPWADASIEFSKRLFDRSTESYKDVMTAAGPELEKTTTLGGMVKRGTSAAGHEAPAAYRLLNGSALARKLVQLNTGINASSVKDYIHQDARVRRASYMKGATESGIANVAEEIGKVGKYSKWLRRAGWVGIGIEVYESKEKIQEANKKGDYATANSEKRQLGGSLVGAYAGGEIGAAAGGYVAFVLLGLGTGGVGLVVVGLFAAVGSYALSEGGKALVK